MTNSNINTLEAALADLLESCTTLSRGAVSPSKHAIFKARLALPSHNKQYIKPVDISVIALFEVVNLFVNTQQALVEIKRTDLPPYVTDKAMLYKWFTITKDEVLTALNFRSMVKLDSGVYSSIRYFEGIEFFEALSKQADSQLYFIADGTIATAMQISKTNYSEFQFHHQAKHTLLINQWLDENPPAY